VCAPRRKKGAAAAGVRCEGRAWRGRGSGGEEGGRRCALGLECAILRRAPHSAAGGAPRLPKHGLPSSSEASTAPQRRLRSTMVSRRAPDTLDGCFSIAGITMTSARAARTIPGRAPLGGGWSLQAGPLTSRVQRSRRLSHPQRASHGAVRDAATCCKCPGARGRRSSPLPEQCTTELGRSRMVAFCGSRPCIAMEKQRRAREGAAAECAALQHLVCPQARDCSACCEDAAEGAGVSRFRLTQQAGLYLPPLRCSAWMDKSAHARGPRSQTGRTPAPHGALAASSS
jgi:hypothetical protein